MKTCLVVDDSRVIRKVAREDTGDRPIVVFCTTENDMAHITEALRAGADEYVMKPFDGDIIASKFQQTGLLRAS